MAEKLEISASPNLATDHLYYSDTYLFSCSAKVLSQYNTQYNEESLTVLVLDQTVMHPQGGRYMVMHSITVIYIVFAYYRWTTS